MMTLRHDQQQIKLNHIENEQKKKKKKTSVVAGWAWGRGTTHNRWESMKLPRPFGALAKMKASNVLFKIPGVYTRAERRAKESKIELRVPGGEIPCS